jgi:hypothetical protein
VKNPIEEPKTNSATINKWSFNYEELSDKAGKYILAHIPHPGGGNISRHHLWGTNMKRGKEKRKNGEREREK